MSRFRVMCCVVALVSVLPGSFAAASGPSDPQPGRMIVLIAKDHDERAFVRPRGPLEPYAKVNTATFDVTYNGFTTEAKAAFQHALDIWATMISSSVPIRVEANWTSLGEGILGNARANFIWKGPVGAPDRNAWYVDALADAIRGSDHRSGEFDIIANFNSDRENWYTGTDGNPPSGEFDLVSVVMHEIGHGLGFSGSAKVEEGSGKWGIDDGSKLVPMAYDLYTELGDGTAILDEGSLPNPSTALADGLLGGSLFWNGVNGVTANGGPRPRLYAPAAWESGSSYSHLNESTYPAGHPDSLMTPKLASAEAIHDPGPVALCMYEDMGWETVEECKATYWVAVASRAPGQNQSKWRSNLSLLNRSSSSATIDLTFTKEDGSTAKRTLTVGANSHRVIADVVNFIGSDGNGSLKVVSSRPLVVVSRVFNQATSGTFGQFYDGKVSSEGANEGDTLWLTMLEQSANFRCNFGFTNTGTTKATVRVTLFNKSGTELTSYNVNIIAGRNKPDNTPFKKRAGLSNIKEAYARVVVTKGSGVRMYASLIDQKTGDATTIPPKE